MDNEYFLRYGQDAVDAGVVSPDGCLDPSALGGGGSAVFEVVEDAEGFFALKGATPSDIYTAALHDPGVKVVLTWAKSTRSLSVLRLSEYRTDPAQCAFTSAVSVSGSYYLLYLKVTPDGVTCEQYQLTGSSS